MSRPCNMCHVMMPSPAALIEHMNKNHFRFSIEKRTTQNTSLFVLGDLQVWISCSRERLLDQAFPLPHLLVTLFSWDNQLVSSTTKLYLVSFTAKNKDLSVLQYLLGRPLHQVEAQYSPQLKPKHCLSPKIQMVVLDPQGLLIPGLQASSRECNHQVPLSLPTRWPGLRRCREFPSAGQPTRPTKQRTAAQRNFWMRAARRKVSARRLKDCRHLNFWTTWSTSWTTPKRIWSNIPTGLFSPSTFSSH